MDILARFTSFDEVHDETIGSLIESVNDYTSLLDLWNDTLGHIDLGLGINDMLYKLVENKGQALGFLLL